MHQNTMTEARKLAGIRPTLPGLTEAASRKKTVAGHMWVLSKDGIGGAYLVTVGDPKKHGSTIKARFSGRHAKDELKLWVRDNVGRKVSKDHVIDVTGLKLVPAEFSDFYMQMRGEAVAEALTERTRPILLKKVELPTGQGDSARWWYNFRVKDLGAAWDVSWTDRTGHDYHGEKIAKTDKRGAAWVKAAYAKAGVKVEDVDDLDEEVRAGQYFVLVDISKPGGKLASKRLYRGTREIDQVAEKMNASGRNIQVIDAKWFKPSYDIMYAQGMVGKPWGEGIEDGDGGDLTEAPKYRKGQTVTLSVPTGAFGKDPKDKAYKVVRVYPTKAHADGPFPRDLFRLIRAGGGALLLSHGEDHYILALGKDGKPDGAAVWMKPHQVKRAMSYEYSESVDESAKFPGSIRVRSQAELLKMSPSAIAKEYRAAEMAHRKVAMSDPEGNKARATYLKVLKAAWRASKEEKRAVREDADITEAEVDAAYAKAHAVTDQAGFQRVFDSLKSKQIVWLSYSAVMSTASKDFRPFTVGRRSHSKKYNVTSITMLHAGQTKPTHRGFQTKLMKRGNGNVSIALGDMGASLLGMYVQKGAKAESIEEAAPKKKGLVLVDRKDPPPHESYAVYYNGVYIAEVFKPMRPEERTGKVYTIQPKSGIKFGADTLDEAKRELKRRGASLARKFGKKAESVDDLDERQKETPALAFPDEDKPTRKGAFKVSATLLKLLKKETGYEPDRLLFKQHQNTILDIPRDKLPGVMRKDNMADAQDVIAMRPKQAFNLFLQNIGKVSPKAGKLIRAVPENNALLFYIYMMRVSGRDMADIVLKRYLTTHQAFKPIKPKKESVEEQMADLFDMGGGEPLEEGPLQSRLGVSSQTLKRVGKKVDEVKLGEFMIQVHEARFHGKDTFVTLIITKDGRKLGGRQADTVEEVIAKTKKQVRKYMKMYSGEKKMRRMRQSGERGTPAYKAARSKARGKMEAVEDDGEELSEMDIMDAEEKVASLLQKAEKAHGAAKKKILVQAASIMKKSGLARERDWVQQFNMRAHEIGLELSTIGTRHPMGKILKAAGVKLPESAPVLLGNTVLAESVASFRAMAGVQPVAEMRGEVSIEKWVRDNRAELTRLIKRAVPNIGKLDDDDLEQWVMNDEGLYDWARSEGVDI